MAKEIEVKARVKNLAKTEKKLVELGCVFSAPISQDDTTFCNYSGRYAEYPEGSVFARIRIKGDGKAIFTVKKPKGKAELVKVEHETAIMDPSEMRNILGMFGYREATRVIKKRRTAELGEYEICLDEVERLGSFIEVEKLAHNDADAEPVLKELIAFLATLGIAPEDRVKEGYDIMIANLDGK